MIKMLNRFEIGDCREVLRQMIAEGVKVQMCVTSPPYWGLRDYGTGTWQGGDGSECEHKRESQSPKPHVTKYGTIGNANTNWDHRNEAGYRHTCAKCGARRVDKQIGLEETAEKHVEELVKVFRLVRQVLSDDGTLWLNYGDAMSIGSSITHELERLIEGSSVLIWYPASIRMTCHCVHISGQNYGPPQGELVPLFGIQRITVKQWDDDLGQVLHLLNAVGDARICPCVGLVTVDGSNLEIIADHGNDIHIVITDRNSNLHTELSISRVMSTRPGEQNNASLSVKEASEPISEGIRYVEPVRDSINLNALCESAPKVDAVDESVALPERVDLDTGCLRDFQVAKAGAQQLRLAFKGGRQLSFSAIGHLSFLYNDRIVRYQTLYQDAIGNANEKAAKQELGVPFLVRRALMRDGWICRQTIIWAKPNPMPESVTDRCTKSHEYLFLLSKSPRYFFDSDAVREKTGNEMSYEEYEARTAPGATWKSGGVTRYAGAHKHDGGQSHPSGRNKRSVWFISSEAFSEAHFATFPRKLVEPCILAGSRPGDTVLDPFGGSGTVAQCAQQLGRQWLGIDLNPTYTPMQQRRTAQTALALAT
jgi:DNA modification methylase